MAQTSSRKSLTVASTAIAARLSSSSAIGHCSATRTGQDTECQFETGNSGKADISHPIQLLTPENFLQDTSNSFLLPIPLQREPRPVCA